MADDNASSIAVAQKLGFVFQMRFNNPRNRDKETLLFAWLAAPERRQLRAVSGSQRARRR